MNRALGLAGIVVALTAAVLGVVVLAVGLRTGRKDRLRAGRAYATIVGVGALVAFLAMERALITRDFSVAYVAEHGSSATPPLFNVATLWSALEGSILLWALILSGYLVAVATRFRKRLDDPLVAWALLTMFAVAAVFFLILVTAANPFGRFDPPPGFDGPGPNPLLQNHILVAFHPPLLYLGYVGFVVPFAFAIGTLASGRIGEGWLVETRRWTLFAWGFLTVGIVLGGWWSYEVLGWGGYWAWDPVENASLMPWLTMTAFLHSVMIQEKRGMLKKWNLGLIIGSFLLSIFGTFITRSGVISSVHSFAQSNVGWFFLGFLVVAGVASFALLAYRWPALAAEARLESMVSREAAFLFNNLIFIVITFSVFWGTLFPVLSEWVRGTKVTVGPPFFNQVNIPLGLLLLFLTGVGPLIAWRQASTANLRRQFLWPVAGLLVTGALLAALRMSDAWAIAAFALAVFVTVTVAQEFVRGTLARHRQYGEAWPLAVVRLVGRNRRRYGGYVVHLGMVMLFVGFAGMAFKSDTEVTLRPGQTTEVRSPYGHVYRFMHQGISQYEQLNRFVSAASLDVYRDGKYLGVMKSEKRQHMDSMGQPTFEPSTEVAIRSDVREDLYIIFAGSVEGTEEAVYRITINPLVWWVWYGGMVLALGGLISMWPTGRAPTPVKRRADQAGYVARVEA